MKKITLLLSVLILFSSCASILNGKVQKMDVNTKNSKSTVYVDDEKQGTGNLVKVKLKRDAKVKQFKVETEGFKDQYFIHYQNQKSPLTIMSYIPFGVLFYPMFYDIGPKSFNYKKGLAVSEKLIPINKKDENEKFIFVKNTEFDVKEENIKVRKIKHRSLKKNKLKKFKDIDSNSEDVNFDNSIFTDALNEILIEYKYTDTTNTIFKSKTNSAYLSAKIVGLDFQLVSQTAARNYMYFIQTVTDIEWDLLDVYGQKLYSKSYKTKSGQFAGHFYGEDTGKMAIKDGITASFLNFMNEDSTRKFLKKTSIQDSPKLESIVLNKSNPVDNIESALQSTFTIKVKEGHGSGFAVSNDGYIVTNFHVVANEEDIIVLGQDNIEYKAKLVRQNDAYDLALLKIEKTFEKHFVIPATKSYNVGNDIFVIGTPKSIELGQTLSKGIISGQRSNNEGINLIQTDASINGGNSGGPLISKEGQLFGIVNAKFSGFGVEGLGFAIPANEVLEALFLK